MISPMAPGGRPTRSTPGQWFRRVVASLIGLAGACSPAGEHAAVSASGAVANERPATQRVIFLGTSLTAGLGVAPGEAYPALIQARLDSLGHRYQVVNAGVSGETSAGGLRRTAWAFRDPFDVLVLELGANDGLRGIDPTAMRANLQGIIDQARARSPNAAIVLAGMEAPPNLGAAYTTAFRNVFVDLAAENGLRLIPFLLVGVAGVASLNQADGIHPTATGHRHIAETVWEVLAELV